MGDPAGEIVAIFSALLQEIPKSWKTRQRVVRQLLLSDNLERMVPARLLAEGLGRLLEEKEQPNSPTVLFLDWAGGGDGARAAAGVMPLLGEKWPGVSFVHVSFSTPAQGLGTLVRSVLVHAGAENSVNVHVVAYNRPFLGLRFSPEDLVRIATLSDLTIVFSPAGAASLRDDSRPESLRMLEISHLSILSYTDPDSLVGDLPQLGDFIEREKGVEAVRFWVQVQREGKFEDFGTSVLGPEGDAEERLWSLLDNSRRHCYRVLVQPLSRDLPTGDPLVCPSRAAIERDVVDYAVLRRIVPAGSRLIAVTRGKQTLV